MVRIRMRRRNAALAATTALLFSVGCSSGGPGPRTVAAASQPATAEIPRQPAAVPSAPAPLITTGPVTVEQQIELVALRAGIVAGLDADVGSSVHQGQTLARLDDRQIAADRDAAEFKVHSLESDLKNWQAEVDVRKTDLRRAEAMRQAGINTQEALDHVRYDLQATEYEVERQNNEMRSAQSTLQSRELELEKTRIGAPFNGVVSQRYVRLGQYVNIGDKLFQVTGTSPMEVRFTLPERDIRVLRRGDLVTVSPSSDFAETTTAAVTRLSPVVDPGSGTIEVTARLTHNIPGLVPGMVASVRVSRAR
jgi:RND family efflux transporter MFP subunit